ncbi:DUF2064 domain-containing protein [Gillisia sp. Hel_I_29]|uniref:TIGR04282 family arsenosugar biosynthesis glycosyltransferase n=1 Tax=Gillisia sp. Hel_I_29 TaxID=1249975 RepID=UPI000553587C|nr:DUF2064 domain-containing protein [Gillisia sp. Hel_I_29]
MTKKTAVLIFANSSAEEQMQKAIPKGQALFDVLNNKTLKTVQRSELPYFLYTEKEQKGNSFGSRFVNAIQEVFDQGFTNIITIGNDTPQLTTSHLIAAATQLEANKVIIGPSTDGGFYLMGIERSQFDAATFLDLPWQSSKLCKSLEAVLNKTSTEIVKLEVLNDLDGFKDLSFFRNCFKGISVEITKLILALFSSGKKVNSLPNILIPRLQFRILFNKGSPNLIVPSL